MGEYFLFYGSILAGTTLALISIPITWKVYNFFLSAVDALNTSGFKYYVNKISAVIGVAVVSFAIGWGIHVYFSTQILGIEGTGIVSEDVVEKQPEEQNTAPFIEPPTLPMPSVESIFPMPTVEEIPTDNNDSLVTPGGIQ